MNAILCMQKPLIYRHYVHVGGARRHWLLHCGHRAHSRGQFAHTNVITLLNADGEIAFQHVGLKQDPALLVAAIAKTASISQR